MSKMTGMTAAALGLAVVVSHAQGASAQAISLKDSKFKEWTFGSYGTGGGTGLMAVTNTVGDPKPALTNTTITGLGQSGNGYGVDTAFTTFETLEGRHFTLRFVFKSGAGAFGGGQAIGLVAAQNGNVYILGGLGGTNTSTTWQPLTFNGKLISKNFGLVSGNGPATPDFTSGIPTQFGLAAGNTDSGALTNYYDKLSLTIK